MLTKKQAIKNMAKARLAFLRAELRENQARDRLREAEADSDRENAAEAKAEDELLKLVDDPFEFGEINKKIEEEAQDALERENSSPS